MKTISQKVLISRGKTFLADFFSYYRIWLTSGNILLGSIRYFGNHLASYKIFLLTPKRLLKTQVIEKKANSPLKKKNWLIFLISSSMIDLMAQVFIKYMLLILHREISASSMGG